MDTRKLTDNEIAMRIVPTRLRWPAPEIAKTNAWDKEREAVICALIRTVHDGCLQAEQDADLSPKGLARRRQALGRQALAELASFRPFQIAEKVVTENIETLHPGQAQMQQLTKALEDLRGAAFLCW